MQYSNHLAKQPQGKLLIAVHKATYMSLLFALFESINYNPLDYVTIFWSTFWITRHPCFEQKSNMFMVNVRLFFSMAQFGLRFRFIENESVKMY